MTHKMYGFLLLWTRRLAAAGVLWGILSQVAVGQELGVGLPGPGQVGDVAAPEPIVPIPEAITVDPGKALIGRRLFADTRLSRDNSMACTSCHALDKGGDDGEARSRTIDGGRRDRNTPTVFNVGLSLLLGWDGQKTDLHAFTESVILGPAGLAGQWPAILGRLGSDAEYPRAFARAYPDGIQPRNVTDSLVHYLRSLITPNSRFDRYLRGDKAALTPDERDGYELFKSYGCASCHQGLNLGGNMVTPRAIFVPGAKAGGRAYKADSSHFGNVGEKQVLRVPGLRNIAQTAPYMYDGSVKSLAEAVNFMGDTMLSRRIAEPHTLLLVKFLHTLNGNLRDEAP